MYKPNLIKNKYMDTANIAKFDPTTAQLNEMVAVTVGITSVDFADKTQMDFLRSSRIELKNTRVKIEKFGKGQREEALAYQKAVIAKEKELIAIIAPEEDRLSKIEDEAKAAEIRASRIESLPERKERLAAIGDDVVATDDDILAMDGIYFEAYFNERVGNKNEATRLAMEAQAETHRIATAHAAAIEAEKTRVAQEVEAKKLATERAEIDAVRLANEKEAARLASEKDAREREEKARIEERARAEADAKAKEEARIAAEVKAAEDAKKAEAEAKAKAEAEAKHREKQAAYMAFRDLHGMTLANKADFKEEVGTDGSVTLWKKLGVFTHKV